MDYRNSKRGTIVKSTKRGPCYKEQRWLANLLSRFYLDQLRLYCRWWCFWFRRSWPAMHHNYLTTCTLTFRHNDLTIWTMNNLSCLKNIMHHNYQPPPPPPPPASTEITAPPSPAAEAIPGIKTPAAVTAPSALALSPPPSARAPWLGCRTLVVCRASLLLSPRHWRLRVLPW